MTASGLPAGRSPDSRRRRRTRRVGTAAMIAAPPTTSRGAPRVVDATIEPAPAHCAAFWRHGPGRGVCVACPPRVREEVAAGGDAIATEALATTTSVTAPTATANLRTRPTRQA
jgi:hypothetical protein